MFASGAVKVIYMELARKWIESETAFETLNFLIAQKFVLVDDSGYPVDYEKLWGLFCSTKRTIFANIVFRWDEHSTIRAIDCLDLPELPDVFAIWSQRIGALSCAGILAVLTLNYFTRGTLLRRVKLFLRVPDEPKE